jgi:hypothetical protein
MKRAALALSLAWAAGCEGSLASPDAPHADAARAPASDAFSPTADAPGLDASEPDAPGVDAFIAAPDAHLTTPDAPSETLRLPPANAPFDYQLGGPYAVPRGVQIVSRDRTERPAAGVFNICYVNGFQAQPDANDFWLNDHPTLVLRDSAGNPVIDPDWDEMLLDVRTAAKRTELAAIVGGWIQQCGRDGFDAVEIDNLDTYSRSGGRITEANAIAYMRLLSDVAHASGLAIAQKNSSEIATRRVEMGTDFAVAEECNRYSECDVYTAAYGNNVFVIEYRRGDFTTGCSRYPNLSIVLRDLNLVPAGSAGYVFDGC